MSAVPGNEPTLPCLYVSRSKRQLCTYLSTYMLDIWGFNGAPPADRACVFRRARPMILSAPSRREDAFGSLQWIIIPKWACGRRLGDSGEVSYMYQQPVFLRGSRVQRRARWVSLASCHTYLTRMSTQYWCTQLDMVLDHGMVLEGKGVCSSEHHQPSHGNARNTAAARHGQFHNRSGYSACMLIWLYMPPSVDAPWKNKLSKALDM